MKPAKRASEERLVLDARIFGQQIAHLEHRLKESDVVRSNLQDQLADLQRNLSTTTQQLASRDAKIMEQAIHSATHESELTRLHHDFDINIRLLEQERSNNLAIQNKLIPGLDAIHRRMDEQQQQNESMAPPPCDHEAAIATYKARITDLESFVSALELRSRTLSVRFETGDLVEILLILLSDAQPFPEC
jgi:chromosome segregation ATPase